MYYRYNINILYIIYIKFGHKKGNPFVTTWMDLEGIMLNEICQTQKDIYCVILLTCGT